MGGRHLPAESSGLASSRVIPNRISLDSDTREQRVSTSM
jgi:hypothetical protein